MSACRKVLRPYRHWGIGVMDLVCPAGSLPALKAAIDNGADCVYIGFRDDTVRVKQARRVNLFSRSG